MKVNLRHLQEGENRLSFDSRKESSLGDVTTRLETQGYRLPVGMRASLKLTKLEPDLYLEGSIEFSVERECSRCAESFLLDVTHGFTMAFSKGTQDPEEDLDVTFFQGDEIELGPVVEEQFVLSLPYTPLCRVDCKGICQQCGKNWNLGACECARGNPTSPFAVLKAWRAESK